MINNKSIIFFLLGTLLFSHTLKGDTLTTVDRQVYEGKMVAFKYGVVIFNAYKFGKYHSKKRFPLSQIWKIEFNEPKKAGLDSSFEIEQKYKSLRQGKRSKRILLSATEKWLDTGIKLKIGQEILFTISGCIYINEEQMVFQNGETEIKWNKKKSLPNQPTGALIARVGEKGAPFYIGNDKAPFQIIENGNLYIGINDYNFGDNSGKFTVIVYY